MAKTISHLVFRLPWWHRAYIQSWAALAKAGFPVDTAALAKHIIDHSKMTLR